MRGVVPVTLLDHALRWYDLGHTPLPVATDGSKRPNVATWRDWQTERPTREQIVRAFAVDHDGLGVLTGTPRDDGHQLLMIEAEGRAVTEGILSALATAMAAAGLAHLWARIIGGYVELTPSGGVHWYVLVAGDPGRNAKLASRPATAEEAASGARVQVLLETRAGGGFSVVAPSAGRSHPTGKPWLAIAGTPADIPVITEAEWHALHAVARTLDQMPEPSGNPGRFTSNPDAGPVGRPGPRSNSAYHDDPEVLRPGDHYIADGDWSILERHGWRVVARHGRELRWRRPGKTEGESATTGRDPDVDRLYVFSSSTPFEQDRPYDRLGVLAVLEHGGDIGAAVKALAAEGWGGPIDTSPAAQLAGLIDPATAYATAPARSTAGHDSQPTAPSGAPAVATEAPPKVTAAAVRHHGQVRFANALAERHAGQLLHVYGLGWHYWTGTHWTHDDRGEAKRAVLDVLRSEWQASFGDKERAREVVACSKATGINGVLDIAAALGPFAATVADLDADPWALNCANGTLDLHTFALRPHDPADRITKVTTAAYDPDAAGPTWEAFLRRILPDVEVRSFLQRYAGVGLIGTVLEHKLALLTGEGRNGKGTWYGAVAETLGKYAITGASDLFMHREGGHPTGEMDLRGARWVVVSENDKGRRLAEATVKRLTGGDKIKARRMRQDFVEFRPSHTAALVTNHLPKVSGDDPALWARLVVIPFDVVIPEGERDVRFGERLALEVDAVLTWIVRGLADYQARGGLDAPDAVLASTEAYQTESDAVKRFVAECCLTYPQMRMETGEAFAAWSRWREGDGAEQVSLKAFGQALDRLGYPAKKSTGGRRLRAGIGLLATDDTDEPQTHWADR